LIAGTDDLMVCINETGIYVKLILPKMIFTQKMTLIIKMER